MAFAHPEDRHLLTFKANFSFSNLNFEANCPLLSTFESLTFKLFAWKLHAYFQVAYSEALFQEIFIFFFLKSFQKSRKICSRTINCSLQSCLHWSYLLTSKSLIFTSEHVTCSLLKSMFSSKRSSLRVYAPLRKLIRWCAIIFWSLMKCGYFTSLRDSRWKELDSIWQCWFRSTTQSGKRARVMLDLAGPKIAVLNEINCRDPNRK